MAQKSILASKFIFSPAGKDQIRFIIEEQFGLYNDENKQLAKKLLSKCFEQLASVEQEKVRSLYNAWYLQELQCQDCDTTMVVVQDEPETKMDKYVCPRCAKHITKK